LEAPTSVVIAVVAFVVAEAAASPGFESFEVAKKRQLIFFFVLPEQNSQTGGSRTSAAS
jgi:hypothetical protein